MPGFDGTGPNGMGPMTGGGRGRCGAWGGVRGYSFPRYGAYGFSYLGPRASREQELDFLKNQAEALKQELRQLETEIGKLAGEKKKK